MENDTLGSPVTPKETLLFRLPPYIFWKTACIQGIQLVSGYLIGWGITNQFGGYWTDAITTYFNVQIVPGKVSFHFTYINMSAIIALVFFIVCIALIRRVHLWKISGLILGLLYGAYHNCEWHNYYNIGGGGQG